MTDGTDPYISGSTDITRYSGTSYAGYLNGWCNGVASSTWCPTVLPASMLSFPRPGDDSYTFFANATVIDGADLYVSDSDRQSLSRYDVATGALTGWVGNIGKSPTAGDPGCAGAAPNTYTPGWCLDGYGALRLASAAPQRAATTVQVRGDSSTRTSKARYVRALGCRFVV